MDVTYTCTYYLSIGNMRLHARTPVDLFCDIYSNRTNCDDADSKELCPTSFRHVVRVSIVCSCLAVYGNCREFTAGFLRSSEKYLEYSWIVLCFGFYIGAYKDDIVKETYSKVFKVF